jgi:class 3 adenylate cyclase
MRHLTLGRRPWWALPCAAGAIAFLWCPVWTDPFTSAGAATWQIMIVSLILAGWISLGQPAQRGNGALMLVLALNASATSLQYVDGGPWAFIGSVLYPVTGILAGWLLLRWPGRQLRTAAQRRLIQGAFVIVPVLTVATDVTWDPRWGGYTGHAWWPTLIRHQNLGTWAYNASQVVDAVLLLTLLVLMTVRIAAATRPERRELLPVTVAAAAFAVLAGTTTIDALAGTDLSDATNVASNISVLTIPVSFLVALVVRRIQRALAVEALLDPRRLTSGDDVGRALSRTIGDRHLTLAMWSAERESYLLSDGTAAPDDLGGRHVVYVASPLDGTPLARIGVRPELAGRTDFLEAVLRAAGTALDNARLQAELQAGQRETQQSRQRLDHAEETRRRLTRLLPGGLAERIGSDPDAFTTAEVLTVTILMSDIRGYTAIAETAEPTQLAGQLNEHRQAMNEALLAHGGTVMQYVGDAVLAVFGAPEHLDQHEARALAAAAEMHASQDALNAVWSGDGLPPFGLGIGLSTGQVAAALLGSRDRVEYTVVGDTVNLAARLCDAARPAGSTVASAATAGACAQTPGYELLPALRVKGRTATVAAYRHPPSSAQVAGAGSPAR